MNVVMFIIMYSKSNTFAISRLEQKNPLYRLIVLPEGIHNTARTEYQNGILFIGGSFTNRTNFFNPNHLCWTPKPSLCINRSQAMATIYRDSIFVIGGEQNSDTTTLERYDSNTRSWKMVCTYEDTKTKRNLSLISLF